MTVKGLTTDLYFKHSQTEERAEAKDVDYMNICVCFDKIGYNTNLEPKFLE